MSARLLLGIDLGTSFVKASVIDSQTGICLASAKNMDVEARVTSLEPGWAEQDPAQWWQYVKDAIRHVNASNQYDPRDISAIGIAYQMHGLVLLDKQQQLLRDSIIWSDSRAVSIGENSFKELGPGFCRTHLLNSPGNFTASKLAWVKAKEPQLYKQIDKLMLPGDYIALQLTGEATMTPSGLSEGIFWDFTRDTISEELLEYFGFSRELFPAVKTVFSPHGQLKSDIARELNLQPGIPITYKAGDQLNNALGLNVMEPGDLAATAGTSGVIYAVGDELNGDPQSRVNCFAHVNHSAEAPRIGTLLCINGCGSMYQWLRRQFGEHISYDWMNEAAAQVPIGSDGLTILPFGNGAERMLGNLNPGAQFRNLDLNTHGKGHLVRAAQEGIAFAFRYGLDILRENGLDPRHIKVNMANLFLSEVFVQAFVNSTELELEVYQQEGSEGAAIGAGIGLGIYSSPGEILEKREPVFRREPKPSLYMRYENSYHQWRRELSGIEKV